MNWVNCIVKCTSEHSTGLIRFLKELSMKFSWYFSRLAPCVPFLEFNSHPEGGLLAASNTNQTHPTCTGTEWPVTTNSNTLFTGHPSKSVSRKHILQCILDWLSIFPFPFPFEDLSEGEELAQCSTSRMEMDLLLLNMRFNSHLDSLLQHPWINLTWKAKKSSVSVVLTNFFLFPYLSMPI